MAKALQCPDCGTRHPLDDVAHLRTFRCRECRRLLKVPAGVAVGTGSPRGAAGRAEPTRSTAAATRTQAAARGGNGAQRVPPSQRGDAVAQQTRKMSAVSAPAATRSPVPRLVRVLVWALAIPAGLVPVLVIGRMVGLLSVDRAVDVFVGVGWERFLAPLVILPLWAASSATVAHLAIEGIARRRT